MPKVIPQSPQRWTNWIGDYSAGDYRSVTPRSREELIQIVRDAVTQKQRVRATGAGHSTTSVARPDDILVNMDELQGSLPLDYLSRSQEQRRPYLVRLLAGTRLKYANRILLKGKAVVNMGSFDWQSMIGAICTGTHGSGLHTGPMAESVRSIEMVTVTEAADGKPDVRLRRIEPTAGITDRSAFEREGSQHQMELIQDDATFYASVVSFGCIGLVYSITLEVVDEYWLAEHNEAEPWSSVKEKLRHYAPTAWGSSAPSVLADGAYWEFLVNSAQTRGKDATKNPSCFVRRRTRCAQIPEKPGNWKDQHDWPPLREQTSAIQRLVESLVRPGIDNASGSVLHLMDVGDRIKKTFENSAPKPPFEGDSRLSRNYWVLRRERDDSKPQEAPESPPEAISNEIAVPLDRAVEAVDRVLEIMSGSEFFYAVPFGVRFVGPSQHYLAMQYGRASCTIELPMLLPNDLAKRRAQFQTFKRALESIEHALCYGSEHLEGRPHWGQYNTVSRHWLERMYARLPEFERVYSLHNAFGTFDNDYTRQIGLRRSEPEPLVTRSAAGLYVATAHAS